MQNKGLIFSFYWDDGIIEDQYKEDKRKYPHISWSPFDRISIKETDKFDNFFSSQFNNTWKGIALQLHLIPDYPDNFTWSFSSGTEPEKPYLIQTNQTNEKDESKQFGLNCIVSVNFNNHIENNPDLRQQLYEKIEETIKSLTSENSKLLDWTACLSLGSEDMVFILLADDIFSFNQFITLLKNVHITYNNEENIPLIRAINAFAGFNDSNFSKNPKADLLLRVTLRPSVICEEFLENIQKRQDICSIDQPSLENNVYIIRLKPSEKLLENYHEGGDFNGDSEFYKKYILSSRSFWVVSKEYSDKNLKTIGGMEENWIIKMNSYNQKALSTVADSGKNTHKDLHAIKTPMAHFILHEYERLMSDLSAAQWKNILQKQYEIIYKFIFEYEGNHQMDQIYPLIKNLQNVLSHIRQAISTIDHVPDFNYFYAGSYNDILKMYYGVISDLLQLGYKFPRPDNTAQYEIIYSVDFESTEKINSNMFCSSDNDCKRRFVMFHLPYDAFTDIPTNIYLLAHEVFHYIAPYDRTDRNQQIINLWIRTCCAKLLELVNEENTNKDIYKIACKLFNNSDWFEECSLKVYKRLCPGKKCLTNDFFSDSRNETLFKMKELDIYSDIFEQLEQLLDLDQTLDPEQAYAFGERLKKIRQKLNPLKHQEYEDALLKYPYLELKGFASALKEAFCDINMLQISHLNLLGYLKLFFSRYFKKYINSDKIIFPDLFDNLINNFGIGYFERRLAIVFDYYADFAEPDLAFQSIKKALKKACQSDEKNNPFSSFLKYCIYVYEQYLTNDKYYRFIYQKLFTIYKKEWDTDSCKDKIIKILRNAIHIQNRIDENMQLITSYQDIDFPVYPPKDSSPNLINLYMPILQPLFMPRRDRLVTSLSEYIKTVCNLSKALANNQFKYGECCWYRGFCNENFTLLPGLFRDKNVLNASQCLYVSQAKRLNSAYMATLLMPDLWTKTTTGIKEHTSCLQHYGMKTSLLDFTMNMLVALHFALNPDNPKDRQKLEEGYTTPKVVIFHPLKYINAVQCLKNGQFQQFNPSGNFPLTASSMTQEELEDYFAFNLSAEYSAHVQQNTKTNYNPCSRVDKYPKPIVIRYSNERIKAQRGTFVAFNLFSELDTTKTPNNYDYLCLENIENNFLNLIPSSAKHNEEKFLDCVYINPVCVEKIREELRIMGIAPENMYPELRQILSALEE